ncbi:MAG: hypothetical protein HY803_05735 [candidate division NC10 bacterium]|nr:hypothetical protein [candidate division NC10 bacterium]
MVMVPIQDLVAAHLASHYPASQGWTIQRDLLLESGSELHFLVSRDRELIVVHCKEERGNVLFDQVDQAAALAADAGAGSAVLFVPIGSFTPPIILEYAARQHVRIEAL